MSNANKPAKKQPLTKMIRSKTQSADVDAVVRLVWLLLRVDRDDIEPREWDFFHHSDNDERQSLESSNQDDDDTLSNTAEKPVIEKNSDEKRCNSKEEESDSTLTVIERGNSVAVSRSLPQLSSASEQNSEVDTTVADTTEEEKSHVNQDQNPDESKTHTNEESDTVQLKDKKKPLSTSDERQSSSKNQSEKPKSSTQRTSKSNTENDNNTEIEQNNRKKNTKAFTIAVCVLGGGLILVAGISVILWRVQQARKAGAMLGKQPPLSSDITVVRHQS